MDLQPEGVSSAGILTEGLEMARIFDGLIVGDETARDYVPRPSKRRGPTRSSPTSLAYSLAARRSDDGSKKGRVKTRKISIQPPNDHRLWTSSGNCVNCSTSRPENSILYMMMLDLLDDGPDVDQAQVNLLIRLLAQLAESQVIAIVALAARTHVSMTIHHKTLHRRIACAR